MNKEQQTTDEITLDEMIKNMKKTADCILWVIIGLPIMAILIILVKWLMI